MTNTAVRFALGRVVATPGALHALAAANCTALPCLARHLAGDWGALCDDDKNANNQAVNDGSRILSAYLLPNEDRIRIITEATIDDKGSRPATTILLPDEY